MRFLGFNIFIAPEWASSYPYWRLFIKRKMIAVAFCQFASLISENLKKKSTVVLDNNPTVMILHKLLKSTKYADLKIMAIWHNENDLRKRAYGFINSQGNNIYFFKLYIGKSETNIFENEKFIVEYLKNKVIYHGVRTPNLEYSHSTPDSSVLIFEPMEKGVRNKQLSISELQEFIGEFQLSRDRVLTFEDVKQLAWFKKFWDHAQPGQRIIAAECLENQQIRVNFGHGDLGSENTFKAGPKKYLVDWECSGFEIPILVDSVAYGLGRKRVFSSTRELLKMGKRCDLCAAAVYLVAKRYRKADKLFQVLGEHGA